MTMTGRFHRLTSRRLALAAAGVGAAVVATVSVLGPTETVASFADDVWARTTGFTASQFRIQSSLTASGTYADNTAVNPLELPGSTTPGTVAFSTPIALAPGATSYAPVYLRTSPGTAKNAVVSISTAAKRSGVTSNDALWGTTVAPITPGFITYAARAVPTTTSSTCNATVWSSSQGTELYAGSSALSAAAPAATFTLASAAGSTHMVCFRFTLASNVATAAPAGTNGASVYPVWTFTGNQAS